MATRGERHGRRRFPEDLALTRLGAMIHAEAAQLIAQCGCALCKVYDKTHTVSSKHILRRAEACLTRFQKPL